MADPAKDFRYTLDGAEIEGYQITDASRYQQSEWPDWLDSRNFLTIDNDNWIVINGEELPIPELGWLVKHKDGRMTIVDAFAFENAVKVVPHVPETFDLPTTEEFTERLLGQDDKLLAEVTMAFEMMLEGEHSAAQSILRNSLSDRTVWCECTPGNCQKTGGKLGCRVNSPLVG